MPRVRSRRAAVSNDAAAIASDGSNAADGAALGALSKKRASEEQRLKIGIYSYRLIVTYDGTGYSGWQLQQTVPTIQKWMEHALTTITRENRETLGVSAAGRTDAGVHADGQARPIDRYIVLKCLLYCYENASRPLAAWIE